MSKRDYDEIAVFGGSVLSEKRTLVWKICNFAELDHKRGKKVKGLHSLPCHGYSWTLSLYPHGCRASSEENEHVSVFLVLKEHEEEVRAHYTIRVGDHNKTTPDNNVFNLKNHEWGWRDFCKRDRLLTKLDDGNLLLEVDIEVYLEETQNIMPRTTLTADLLKMLASGERSDVTFFVGGKTGRRFQAHKNILAFRSPILAELAADNTDAAEIELEGVDDELFNALLRNVYSDEPPPTDMLEGSARELLSMADRFGCANLKLLAESKLVESGINTKTAADLLLFADAKNCALLKESALNYIKANTASVMKSPEWEKVKESSALLSELFEAAFSKSSPAEDGDALDCMTIVALRRELQKKRLSEDGTREMLVGRLKESAAKKPRVDS